MVWQDNTCVKLEVFVSYYKNVKNGLTDRQENAIYILSIVCYLIQNEFEALTRHKLQDIYVS